MSISAHLHTCLRLGRSLAARLQPVMPLVTRLVIGYAFVRTGLGKWQHYERTVDFFADVGIPLASFNAGFIATLELVGGALLMLGLGTRVFGALLSATMLVALATADRGRFLGAFSSGEYGLTDVVPFVFLLFLGWLVAHGGGSLSLDYLVAKLRPRGAARPLVPPARV